MPPYCTVLHQVFKRTKIIHYFTQILLDVVSLAIRCRPGMYNSVGALSKKIGGPRYFGSCFRLFFKDFFAGLVPTTPLSCTVR